MRLFGTPCILSGLEKAANSALNTNRHKSNYSSSFVLDGETVADYPYRMAKKYSIPDTLVAVSKAGNGFDSAPEIDGDSISFTTREHGNVGDETPGVEDRMAAIKLIREIEAAHPNVRGRLGGCDEWTSADFRAYDRKVPARPPGQKEIAKALELAGEVFKEKTAQKEFNVRWSSTGHNMFIEWKDPAARQDRMLVHSAYLSISVLGGSELDKQGKEAKTGVDALKWTFALNVGRHTVGLDSLKKNDIAQALDQLSADSDGLKDIFPLSYFVAKPDNKGWVSRHDYNGTGGGVYSKREAQRIEAYSLHFAHRLADACKGSIVEERIGYPDKPFSESGEDRLAGKSATQAVAGAAPKMRAK